MADRGKLYDNRPGDEAIARRLRNDGLGRCALRPLIVRRANTVTGAPYRVVVLGAYDGPALVTWYERDRRGHIRRAPDFQLGEPREPESGELDELAASPGPGRRTC